MDPIDRLDRLITNVIRLRVWLNLKFSKTNIVGPGIYFWSVYGAATLVETVRWGMRRRFARLERVLRRKQTPRARDDRDDYGGGGVHGDGGGGGEVYTNHDDEQITRCAYVVNTYLGWRYHAGPRRRRPIGRPTWRGFLSVSRRQITTTGPEITRASRGIPIHRAADQSSHFSALATRFFSATVCRFPDPLPSTQDRFRNAPGPLSTTVIVAVIVYGAVPSTQLLMHSGRTFNRFLSKYRIMPPTPVVCHFIAHFNENNSLPWYIVLYCSTHRLCLKNSIYLLLCDVLYTYIYKKKFILDILRQ